METFYNNLIEVFEKAMQHNVEGEHALFEVYQAHAASGYHLHRELLTTVLGGDSMADLFSNIINTRYGSKRHPVDEETAAAYRREWTYKVGKVLDNLDLETIYLFRDGSAINVSQGKVVEVSEKIAGTPQTPA
jgi:hypothetical protein